MAIAILAQAVAPHALSQSADLIPSYHEIQPHALMNVSERKLVHLVMDDIE
jgi:hypothetical protein